MQDSIRPALSNPDLPLVRYRLGFEAQDSVLLPPFAGALWRGVLGAALKRMADGDTPAPPSGAIPRRDLYRYLFETPPPPDAVKMRRYPAAPHPYILAVPSDRAPQDIRPGQGLHLDVTLIGAANQAAAAVIVAFARAGEAGLGKERGQANLVSVETVWHADEPECRPVSFDDLPAPDSPTVPPAPSQVLIELLSPLRLVVDGRVCTPRAFRPSDLLGSLIRRISMLMTFHTQHDLDVDFRGLNSLARELRAEHADLAFADQTRWSAASRSEIQMGGLVGTFRLDLAETGALWPYLWLGQWTHAGKGAVMGLGAYRIRAA